MDPILVLQNANESITAVLAGTITTTNPIYSVMWNGDGGPANPVGALTGATAKTLLTGNSPRYVESLQIYNADSASITATLAKVVNGTSYNLLQRVLAAGDTLVWSQKEGATVILASGPPVVSGGSSGLIADATFSIAAQVGTARAVSIQIKDADGVNLTERAVFQGYLSPSAVGDGSASTNPISPTISVGASGYLVLIGPIGYQTDATGLIILNIDAGMMATGTYYFVVVLSTGEIVVSSAIVLV